MSRDTPLFTVMAMRYVDHASAGEAFERLMPAFEELTGAGDSLFRFALDGEPTVAVIAWDAGEARHAAIATLPWGADSVPVELPTTIAQQLAIRSREAAPANPHSIRRVRRGPTGVVLRDEEWTAGSAEPGGVEPGR